VKPKKVFFLKRKKILHEKSRTREIQILDPDEKNEGARKVKN